MLAGHSLGATSSLLAAGLAPERVRALVLFEPVLLDRARTGEVLRDAPIVQAALRRRAVFPDRLAALQSYRGRGAFVGWSEAELADYVTAGLRDSADGPAALVCRPEWEAETYARYDCDPTAALSAARHPVRIFAAEHGSTVGAEARRAADRLGVPLEVVPDATQFLPMLRPELVRRALLEAAS